MLQHPCYETLKEGAEPDKSNAARFGVPHGRD